MVSISVRSSVRERLKIFIVVLWFGVRMSADRPDRDGPRRPVKAVSDGVDSCPFVARDFENIHEGLYFSCNGIRDWLKIDCSEQSCMKLEVIAN